MEALVFQARLGKEQMLIPLEKHKTKETEELTGICASLTSKMEKL